MPAINLIHPLLPEAIKWPLDMHEPFIVHFASPALIRRFRYAYADEDFVTVPGFKRPVVFDILIDQAMRPLHGWESPAMLHLSEGKEYPLYERSPTDEPTTEAGYFDRLSQMARWAEYKMKLEKTEDYQIMIAEKKRESEKARHAEMKLIQDREAILDRLLLPPPQLRSRIQQKISFFDRTTYQDVMDNSLPLFWTTAPSSAEARLGYGSQYSVEGHMVSACFDEDMDDVVLLVDKYFASKLWIGNNTTGTLPAALKVFRRMIRSSKCRDLEGEEAQNRASFGIVEGVGVSIAATTNVERGEADHDVSGRDRVELDGLNVDFSWEQIREACIEARAFKRVGLQLTAALVEPV